MTAQQVRNALVYGTAALALSACGGSGGTGINPISAPPVTPTPTPTPTPAPAPATALNIFASAPTGELAVSAINYSGAYLDLHPMASLTVALTSVETTTRVNAHTAHTMTCCARL